MLRNVALAVLVLVVGALLLPVLASILGVILGVALLGILLLGAVGWHEEDDWPSGNL